jgi:hypothetical protein
MKKGGKKNKKKEKRKKKTKPTVHNQGSFPQ